MLRGEVAGEVRLARKGESSAESEQGEIAAVLAALMAERAVPAA
jgi:hypothetical protein